MKRASLLLVLLSVTLVFDLPRLFAASIVDSEKKSIIFDQPFQRIISLYPAHTANLIELGLKDRIVALGFSDNQIGGLPKLQFNDDTERLLALRPDLVLIRPMISRSYPQLVAALEQNKVRVVSLQPTTMDELFFYWRALGALGGKEAEAERMVAAFHKGIDFFSRQLQQIPAERRKKVYFESIHKQMKTFAPGSMAMFVLETAGGFNIAQDAEQVRNTNIAAYGKERLLSKGAEIDLYLAQSGKMNPVCVEDILKEPGFQVIKAVRERQVFLVDEEMVSRPTLGLLHGIAFVRSLLYPDYPQDGLSRL